MLGRLIPREGRFFELFRESAGLILEAAREFKKMLSDLPNAAEHAKTIKDIEHKADGVTHQTNELLHRIFITPLDREDIHKLICELDDIVDFIDAAASRISIYDVKAVTPEILELADVTITSVEHVRQAVIGLEDLKHREVILKACVEINRLENEADRLLRQGVAKLFRDEQDTRTLIKLKEIYELVETVTDRCEDVANIIEGIVLENG